MKSSATTRWKYVQQKQKHFHLWKWVLPSIMDVTIKFAWTVSLICLYGITTLIVISLSEIFLTTTLSLFILLDDVWVLKCIIFKNMKILFKLSVMSHSSFVFTSDH
jgi:hypothetical protein